MQMRYKIFAAVIIVVIATFAFLFGKGYQKEQSDIYEKELKRQYEQQLQTLERRLTLSNQLRDSLVHRINTLGTYYEDILRRDSVVIDSLKRVPKKYDKLTDKQTEDLMIKRWQKRDGIR